MFTLSLPEISLSGVLTNIRIFADENSYPGPLATIPLQVMNQLKNILCQIFFKNYKYLKIGLYARIEIKTIAV